MVRYHNFKQGSDEWFDFKDGKMSASNATAIGANGVGLKTYCTELAMQLCGVRKEHYVNSDIKRGNECEPLAVTAYELTKGVKVDSIGCISNDKYENVVISPDGLIGTNGGVEIKAKNNLKHFSLINGDKKEIPFNQIQMSLLVSEREWWDFVSFNPNFVKCTFIVRIFPDCDYFEKLKTAFDIGNNLILNSKNKYNNYNL